MIKRIIRSLSGDSGQSVEQEKLSIKINASFPGGVEKMGKFSEKDVFIVGFPKSGNTLMQHIIAHLYYGINEKAGRSLVNLICPDVYANKYYFRLNDTCFFKSHELPKPHHRKVIYLVRDGRDALISYSVMMEKMGHKFDLNGALACKTQIMGTYWHDHVNEWMVQRTNLDKFMVLKFEDIIDKKIEVIKRICDFLEIKRSDEEMKKVADLTSIEHMKSLESRTDWMKMRSENGFAKGKGFIDKGVSGSQKLFPNKEYIDQFNAVSKEQLELFNYNVVYEKS